MKKFNLKNYKDCYFRFNKYYENQNLAVEILSDEEWRGENIATLSINLPDCRLKPAFFWVKGYDGYPEMAKTLVDLEIIKPVIDESKGKVVEVASGYATFILYRLTKKAFEYSENEDRVVSKFLSENFED